MNGKPGPFSYSEDSYGTSRDDYSDNTSPNDFYCQACKASMNSITTWKFHTSGKRHKKKMSSAAYGIERQTRIPQHANAKKMKLSCAGPTPFLTKSSNEIAQMQHQFDKMNNEPVVGLDYVIEIWRMDNTAQPVYCCTLCDSDCQAISIINHVIGARHRNRYIKRKNDHIHGRLSTGELSYYAKKFEYKFGKGFIKVAHQISEEDEEDKRVNIKRERVSDESDHELAGPSNRHSRSRDEHRRAVKKSKLSGPSELKIKSVNPKNLRKRYFSINEAKKTAIMGNIQVFDVDGQNAETLKDQLKKIHNVLIHYKLQSLSSQEIMKMSKGFMNRDYKSIFPYFNLDGMKKDIYEVMGAPSEVED